MQESLNKISAWLNKVVDRVDYYLKVVKWFFNALKAISDILASFPKYTPDETVAGKNEGDERTS